MKNKPKTGGPAFPRPIGASRDKYSTSQDGMSLRAWFAGMVAPAVYAAVTPDTSLVDIAAQSVLFADALIEQLEKP